MSTLIISNLLLWIAVIILTLVVFVLTRQIGVLHQRIAPVGALMIDKGPDVGDDLSVLDVMDISNQPIRIADKQSGQKSQLLFFMSPDCPVCKSLFPALKSIYKDEKEWLEIIFVSDGKSKDEHLHLIESNQLTEFRYVLDAEIGMRYQVGKLPYSILISEGKVMAKGLCNSREHLESLFVARERDVASVQEYFQKDDDNKNQGHTQYLNEEKINEVAG